MKSSENKYFVPFVWATTIVERARKEGKIKGEIAVQQVLDVSIIVRFLCCLKMKFAHELCWQTTKQCQSHKIVLISLQAMFNMH